MTDDDRPTIIELLDEIADSLEGDGFDMWPDTIRRAVQLLQAQHPVCIECEMAWDAVRDGQR